MQDLFALSFLFSCINIVYSSFYRMHVLIQFVLLCYMLNGLKIYYFHDRVIAAAKKICIEDKVEERRQQGRNRKKMKKQR